MNQKLLFKNALIKFLMANNWNKIELKNLSIHSLIGIVNHYGGINSFKSFIRKQN